MRGGGGRFDDGAKLTQVAFQDGYACFGLQGLISRRNHFGIVIGRMGTIGVDAFTIYGERILVHDVIEVKARVAIDMMRALTTVDEVIRIRTGEKGSDAI